MKFSIIVLTLILAGGCNKMAINKTENQIVNIANKKIEELKYNPTDYDVTIKMDSFWIVDYKLKDKLMLGGAPQVWINPSTKEVIKVLQRQ